MKEALPVQIRTAGDKAACDNVHGLAMQFLGKIRDFAVSQELPSYSNYFDLKEGGQIFAQYGPAGRQLVEITMPEGGAPLREQLDMFGPNDLPDTIVEGGCDCKNVVISCGEVDWGSIESFKGRSGRKYEALEGDHPHSYSLNIPAQAVQHYPISKGDTPKISDVAGACAVYQNPGPAWAIKKAYLFTVCEDEKNEDENRYRPVLLPKKCKACYYWELDSVLGDCDGQIYEGTDVPCGMGVGVIGREEYNYRIGHTKTKHSTMGEDQEVPTNNGEFANDVEQDGSPHVPGNDLTGTTVQTTLAENAVPVEAIIKRMEYDPASTDMSRLRGTKGSAVNIGDHLFAQAGYRAYYDLDCEEPDGTFVWYVPPRNEPRSRCEEKQTLKLYCASDDKLIQSVKLNIIYNRETWAFHTMWASKSYTESTSGAYDEVDTSQPVCENEAVSHIAAAYQYKETKHEGYVYTTDSSGAVHHIASLGGHTCTGKPFGVPFEYAGTSYWWNETGSFYKADGKVRPYDWGLAKRGETKYNRIRLGCPHTVLTAPPGELVGISNVWSYPPIGPYRIPGQTFDYTEPERSGACDASYEETTDCMPLGYVHSLGTTVSSQSSNLSSGTVTNTTTWTYVFHSYNWLTGNFDDSDAGSEAVTTKLYAGGMTAGVESHYDQTAAESGAFYLHWDDTTDRPTEQAVDTSIFGYNFRGLKVRTLKSVMRTWFADGMQDDKPCE